MIFQHGLDQELREEYQSRGEIILSTCQMANLEKTKRVYFIIVPVVILSLLVWFRQHGEFKLYGGGAGEVLFKVTLFLGWWLLLTVAHSYQHDYQGTMGMLKVHLFMAGRLAFALMVSALYLYRFTIYD